METYCVLANFGGKTVSSQEEGKEAEQTFVKAIESLGGKLVANFVLLGRYDALFLIQVPDAKAIVALMHGAKHIQPGIRTETMRAFTSEEYEEVIQNVQSMMKG
jgi:uncharacterized protein with GYD domain